MSVGNLIPALNKIAEATEEAGDAAKEAIIGFNRMVNGQLQFHALSGKERRRVRRAEARREASIQRHGERTYNRQQRQQEFDAGTVRQQLRILRGEITVTAAMHRNLTEHIMRQQDLHDREQLAPERKAQQEVAREDRLRVRRAARFFAGQPRGKDLLPKNFEIHSHLLPVGYAGKGGTV